MLRRALGPRSRIVIGRDPFTEGPCRFEGVESFSQWLHRRLDWWDRGSCEGIDPKARRRDVALARKIEDSTNFDAVVLWSTSAVAEQLFACCVSAQLVERAGHPQVFHARPSDRQVGFCTPDVLACTSMRPVAKRELRTAAATWHAFVAPTPTRFARGVCGPFQGPLTDRLSHLLPRFPAFTDGLTLWERRLLERVQANPDESTARTLGNVMGIRFDREDLARPDACDFIGDMILFDFLVELAAAGLLTMVGDGATLRGTRFRLTEFGRNVLAGRAHRAAGCLQRWVGGTQLDSRTGELWWYVDGKVVRRCAPSPRGRRE